MTNTERIIADDRNETDACQRGTTGCCINHTAEWKRDRSGESSCETW